ncbi:MAG TPA: hypothetical protein VMN60_07975 [Longimicrobiales bacterium]|nr:hypothetical protein [Longimicrobiales bacterium]
MRFVLFVAPDRVRRARAPRQSRVLDIDYGTLHLLRARVHRVVEVGAGKAD